MTLESSRKPSVGEFALLKVAAVEPIGIFLEWNSPKDLFLPHAERTRDLTVGQEVIVFIYLDKADRPTATMRLKKCFEPPSDEIIENQKVNLMIFSHTDLGYKAIIEGKFEGVLYQNEVFQPLMYGQRVQGIIKKLREDGKIDLSLTATEDTASRILHLLRKEKGFLAINDKTPAQKIYELFGVSKKKYKIALGGLYKKRLISVHPEGIRLI